MSRAVVFAYHNVGYRCLSVLIAGGVDIALVVTHEDDPNENVWFGNVASLAREHGIPVVTPDDPNTDAFVAQLAALKPDLIFSFYYRKMLSPALLELAPMGAFNMHGSMLPKYRGRVPVNWAIIRGETESGATLHEMLAKPDAGRIVDQMSVPILPNDTAREVFEKVTVAAELVLHRSLPALKQGTADLKPQNLAEGSYFSGRKAEDGRINWQQSAQALHNLVRAVSEPYPGAFADISGHRLIIWRSIVRTETHLAAGHLHAIDGRIFASMADGSCLELLRAEVDGQVLTATSFVTIFGDTACALPLLEAN
ncbi:formyltransferase [Burkholderiaceae bacterium DAT-1]|nr:formyltransferase [Burkholderiaceae bacterium DAT-1]